MKQNSSLGNKNPAAARRARVTNPKPSTIRRKDSLYKRGTTGGQVRTCPGIDEDTQTNAQPNLLAVNEDVPDEDVYLFNPHDG